MRIFHCFVCVRECTGEEIDCVSLTLCNLQGDAKVYAFTVVTIQQSA